MNIGLISNAAWGVSVLRKELVRFLTSEGHQVTVLCEIDNNVSQLHSLGVRVIRWRVSRRGMNIFSELLSILQLRRRLAASCFDLILNFTPKGVIYGSIAASWSRQLNVFSVITGLGFIFAGEDIRRQALRPLIRCAYRYALRKNSIVFFQNRDDASVFRTYNIVGRQPSACVSGSGVDLVRFAPRARAVQPREIQFLMIARLIRDKGVIEYLRAITILKARRIPARAVLVGPFDDNPTAISPHVLRVYERAGAVQYGGVAVDVRPFLHEADVFVLPSYYREGVPRALLEALAMAKPIITTNTPGCREVVRDGLNGFLVPPRDVTALAAAMQLLATDPDLIATMGRRSRSIAESEFNIDRVNALMWDRISTSLMSTDLY